MRCLLLILISQLFFISIHAKIFNVKKFGAKGDGRTDDTKSIQTAINAAAGSTANTIYFPRGVYILKTITVTPNYLENYFVYLHSNLTFKGDGVTSIIKLADHVLDKTDSNANAHLFYGKNIENLHYTSLMIDMNGAKNLTPKDVIKNQCAIFVNQGYNVTLKRITIKNNAGRNMVIIYSKGNKFISEDCVFLNGGHYVGTKVNNVYQMDFSFVYCEWDSGRVTNNLIEEQNADIALTSLCGGIELHGSNSYASGNTIIGCNPGLYISSSWHPMENTRVEKNRFLECVRGISFWVNYPMNNIFIQDNSIKLTHFRSWKGYTINGIEMPNGNTEIYDFTHANASTVTNLTINNNIINGPSNSSNTDRTAGIVLHSVYNTKITGNIITGMNFGGVILQGSKWGSGAVKIERNKFINFKSNYDLVSPAAYIVVFDSYRVQEKRNPGIKNILISSNEFTRNQTAMETVSKSMKKGEFYGSFVALQGNRHKEVLFLNNKFSDTSEQVRHVNTD